MPTRISRERLLGRPAKLVLRINGEEYVAYGYLFEEDGIASFEVEQLHPLRRNNG